MISSDVKELRGLGWMVVRYRGSSSNFRIVQTTEGTAVGSETAVRSDATLKVGLG